MGHVGLICHGDNGEVHLIHSSEPAGLAEELIDEYIARSTKDLAEDAAGKPRLVGFKFLRLCDEPLKHLRRASTAPMPRVTLPSGGEAKFSNLQRKPMCDTLQNVETSPTHRSIGRS